MKIIILIIVLFNSFLSFSQSITSSSVSDTTPAIMSKVDSTGASELFERYKKLKKKSTENIINNEFDYDNKIQDSVDKDSISNKRVLKEKTIQNQNKAASTKKNID